MDFRIISLPPFKAASSGIDKEYNFSPNGILGKFNRYFSSINLSERDRFIPRDFLCFDEEKQGLVWWWALSDDMDYGSNEVVDFEGGYYVTYFFKDGDEETVESYIIKPWNILRFLIFSNWISDKIIMLWDILLHHQRL